MSLYTRTARKPDVRNHSLIPRIIGRAEHKHTLSSEEGKAKMAAPVQIEVWNPNGKYRVVSTKSMPGTRWIDLLVQQDCRVEICTQKKTILSVEDILAVIGDKCDGVIGQLTEDWGETLFSALSKAGGKAFSNMAVGYNNVDVNAATKYGVAVGNTPGVLTETTAELAASLSLAAARRIVEADEFMRNGKYEGWLPHLFVGNLLKGQTVGVIGAGRIGSAYARMMVEGFKMNLIYFDLYQSTRLENFVTAYGQFLKSNGEQPVTWKRASSMDEVLREADVISLHPVLDKTTFHLVNKERLAMMKKEAILVNCSRGPVVDEEALVQHLRENPMFRVGLDVFEDEPYMKPGLADMKNAVVVPHIASASKWTREGMATLAALNVLGQIKGYPVWHDPNKVDVFLNENASPPSACPSIVNSKALGLPVSKILKVK
nr:glycerate dehydrogenase [Ipomoea batatas]